MSGFVVLPRQGNRDPRNESRLFPHASNASDISDISDIS